MLSLRLDAAYCAIVAVLLVVLARPVSGWFDLRPAVIVAVALAVGVWAFALHRAAGGGHLRRWLTGVLVANVAAATGIALLAAVRPWPGAVTLLLVAVAVEVAAFAVSQAVALRTRAPGR